MRGRAAFSDDILVADRQYHRSKPEELGEPGTRHGLVPFCSLSYVMPLRPWLVTDISRADHDGPLVPMPIPSPLYSLTTASIHAILSSLLPAIPLAHSSPHPLHAGGPVHPTRPRGASPAPSAAVSADDTDASTTSTTDCASGEGADAAVEGGVEAATWRSASQSPPKSNSERTSTASRKEQ